jgi:hypothetical protein
MTTIQQVKDHAAMLQIQFLLSGEEWSADTLDNIAEILRHAGYTINEVKEPATYFERDERLRD